MTKEELLVANEKSLAEYRGEDEVLSFAEILKRESEKGIPQVSVKLGAGFSHLNGLIGGCRGGELVVVSGLPKSGKTLLLQTFTYNFGSQNILTLWLSFEMPIIQFIMRFPGYPVPPLSFSPARIASNTMSWLERRIWEAKIKYDIRVVAIDHLHYLVDLAAMRNPSLEIGSVLRALVLIARKYNIVIFLIAHTGKVGSKKIPTGADIRDSSFILQEPATVLMIYRIKDDTYRGITNQAWVSVVANRQLGTMRKRVRVIKGENGLLGELDLSFEEKKDEEDEPDEEDDKQK